MSDEQLTIRPCRGAEEFRATHDFLAPADVERIESSLATAHLPA